VKYIVAACGFLACICAPTIVLARTVEPSQDLQSPAIETSPLLDWNLLEHLAQQQPAEPVPTPPPPAPETTPPADPAPPAAEEGAAPADPNLGEEGQLDEDFSLGDIPNVEIVELTADKSKKALDAYVLVRDKYKDAELENYENLQEFVDKAPQGKAMESDIKTAGFISVSEWDTIITSLSFAYDNSINDQTTAIKQQITELQADTSMAQDMRDRMVKALNAMIPSDNNKKVLDEIKADPAYAEKIKLLETESE
jgi:hypothetical protein